MKGGFIQPSTSLFLNVGAEYKHALFFFLQLLERFFAHKMHWPATTFYVTHYLKDLSSLEEKGGDSAPLMWCKQTDVSTQQVASSESTLVAESASLGSEDGAPAVCKLQSVCTTLKVLNLTVCSTSCPPPPFFSERTWPCSEAHRFFLIPQLKLVSTFRSVMISSWSH